MWRLCRKMAAFLLCSFPRCFCALFLLLLAGRLCCLPFPFLGQAISLPVSLVFLPPKKIFLPLDKITISAQNIPAHCPSFPPKRKLWFRPLWLLLQDANVFFALGGLRQDVTRGSCFPSASLGNAAISPSFFLVVRLQ